MSRWMSNTPPRPPSSPIAMRRIEKITVIVRYTKTGSTMDSLLLRELLEAPPRVLPILHDLLRLLRRELECLGGRGDWSPRVALRGFREPRPAVPAERVPLPGPRSAVRAEPGRRRSRAGRRGRRGGVRRSRRGKRCGDGEGARSGGGPRLGGR